MSDLFLNGLRLTDKDMIQNILNNSFIVDYGFIDKINDDNTLNIKHIKKQKTFDDSELEETITNNIEVLYPCSSNFKIIFELKKGDGVLLIGLKNYALIEGENEPSTQDIFLHYSQECLKAIPVGFCDDPETVISIKKDEIKLETSIKSTIIELKDELKIETDANLNIKANNNTIKTDTTSVLINNHFKVKQN